MAAGDAVDLDPVQAGPARRTLPCADQRDDVVAAAGEAAEDFVQVDLGSAGQRVRAILPIQDEQLQRASPGPAVPAALPVRRMSASSTPFTKRGLSAVPYFSASRIASWMETRGGTSSR